jgi:hypothetical protein
MKPIHLDYDKYKDLSLDLIPSSKAEAIRQIKNGISYTTTIDGIAYLIDVNEDNELVVID